MRGGVCAGAGFLLAVLWFDLMFDVQVLGRSDDDLSDEVVGSIAGYYGRVTTQARPMNRLVAAAMVATIAGVVIELAQGSVRPAWIRWASLALILAPVALAAARTVPAAVRLGTRQDPLRRQRELARSICRQHLFCLAAITALLALQLAASGR